MRKLKILALIVCCYILPKVSFSQLVHFELLGVGGLYSVNFDSRFSEKSHLGFRIGLSILPISPTYFTVPLQLNYVSAHTHGVEIGAGITFVNSFVQQFNGQQFSGLDDASIIPTVTVAYRFSVKKSLSFRVGFTSILDGNIAFPLNIFWPTLSIGHQF